MHIPRPCSLHPIGTAASPTTPSVRVGSGSIGPWIVTSDELDPRGPQCLTPTNRFNAMLGGAGAATSMAMFFGAVGTTLGWFSEDTSWAITGAMAAAGALYAGSHYQVQPGLNFNWNSESVIPSAAAGSR